VRELVAHLARAQRAFDAGRLEEAERALDEAVAIDPKNVQAADLHQQITRLRERLSSAAEARDAKPALPERPLPRRPPATRLPREDATAPPAWQPKPPAAWSAFEQRVRDRRADLAVATAREALARGDRAAVETALAHLAEVAPDDPRQAELFAEVGTSAVASTSESAPRVPAPDVSWDNIDIKAAASPLPRAIGSDNGRPVDAAATALTLGKKVALVAAVFVVSAAIASWLYSTAPVDHAEAPQSMQADAQAGSTGVPAERRETDNAGADLPPTAVEPAPLPYNTLPELSDAPVIPPDVSSASEPAPAHPTKDAPPAAASQEPTTVKPALIRPEQDRAPVAANTPPRLSVSTPPLEGPVQAQITPAIGTGSNARDTGLSAAVTPVPEPEAPPPAPAAAPASVHPPADTSAVRGVLDEYADAFNALDAEATQRVWPGVDLRGLRRAFDQLSTQRIAFTRCDVNASVDVADAVCVGHATWAPKVGDRSPRSEARTWRFALGRNGGDWVIDSVEVQR
jgi:hypothetical protein